MILLVYIFKWKHSYVHCSNGILFNHKNDIMTKAISTVFYGLICMHIIKL